MNINVTRSFMPPIEEYTKEIEGLWESHWLSNGGVLSKKLEEQIKEYLGVGHARLFANGHLALEMTLETLDMAGEVITTPYTMCSTVHAIVRNGLKPVFCDIKEENYTINPDLIENLITEKTVAIVATHVYGFLCDVDRIAKIAKKHNLKVIYDAAHAFGVKLSGVGAGAFGDAAMFSTHATKVFQTIEGGIVVYHDAELFKSMKYRVNFGYTSEEEIDYVGTNAKMNEFEAAMGICNLRHIDEALANRKTAGERYYERLNDVPGIKLCDIPEELEWNYAYFPVLFDGYKEDRNEIQKKLKRRNIFARKYFYPIINECKAYKNDYGNISVPVAKYVSERVLALPLFADLTLEFVDEICNIILE